MQEPSCPGAVTGRRALQTHDLASEPGLVPWDRGQRISNGHRVEGVSLALHCSEFILLFKADVSKIHSINTVYFL